MEINPDNSMLYNNLGVIYFNSHNHNRAVNYLDKAITLNPDYTDAQNNLRYVKQKRKENNFKLALGPMLVIIVLAILLLSLKSKN